MQFRPSSSKNKNIEKEFKNLRKELLDLTLRNQLLNFKPRNKTLTIINQSPMNMYKTLVLENKKMHFAPNKKEASKKSRFSSIWEHPPLDLSIFSEGDKTLKAELSPSELQKRLFYIDQQARTMLQEQGYNILYIAVGFLEWVDKRKPKQKNLAPLILIPVTMERIKVGNSFSLYWTEEDLQTNISLQAKLKDDGIKLPEFEPTSYIEGVDRYLNEVAKAVKPMKGWKVINNVALGFFSFTKFVMYNDLNPESWGEDVDLTQHGLIESIFDPSKNVYEETFNEEDVDKKLHYKDMYQVLDADSSQIAVIENVKAEHNLVVEGPPGTGKSQTIVNLIAELIAEGKTVLFVSEKMAALEVVKTRLANVGLGKFVLELHSHKARRKKLLKNLQRATNVRATNELKLNQTLRKLETLRDQLDDYAELIHTPLYDVNLSAFELYGMKESANEYFSLNNKVLPLVRFNTPEKVTLKDLDDIVISLESLAELYTTISKNNPWSKCNPDSLLPADLREIELLIVDTLDAMDQFRYETDFINELYGIAIPSTLKEYKYSIEALKILESSNSKSIDSSILLNKEWYENPKQANDLINILKNYQASISLFDKFTDYLFIADLDSIILDLEKDLNKKFHIFGNNSNKEELSKLYNNGVPSDKRAYNDLITVRQHIKVKESLKNYKPLATCYFGNLWSENADINELEDIVSWMAKFTQLLKLGIFSDTTIELFSKDLYNFNVESEMADYLEKGKLFSENLSKLQSKLKPRSKLIFKKDVDDVPFDDWEKQLNEWRGQLSSLHLWSQYSNTKKAIMETPASIFVKTIEKRGIKKEDVKSLVLGNFADSLLNIVFTDNPTLATFIGELHDNRIEEFQDLDRKIINLNRKRIFNKLNKNIPKIFGGADDPEAKILAGEFTRKSGHLPVRTLLERAGGLIKKIKPVFMMSPLSIAQYLDPTNPKLQFDVVIFDEASQVKPEDALGAFMRGKTAVVMGDTQQLPPTSFFDQMTDAESEEEVATALDMESILHLCKLSFPVKMLKWHYRSRHESLIAVSNKEFYDNELLVYPSPSHNDSELGLKFKYDPNTSYDRGNSSVNSGEAKEVVKEIFKHFEKYGDKKSLGVGTFSVAQKNAILEELEIERKAHPEYEPLFSDKKDERFFVKNLETIQGDERDVILMSIGYGYDMEGKMSLNFGPLNQDGGERRLNVLITRAREKCVVFANFKSHDIHLTANPPFGIKALKNFIEYAENISYGQVQEEEFDESLFEDAVASFLIENGYNVNKNIGCAGFRVDLAIVDDENPGKYILGIECDGKSYSSSKVARDRDRLRQQVLKGLGWNLYHLWSTDWYRNRELAKSRLLDFIKSTSINTKVNEIKSELAAAEAMKINPVTTVVIEKNSTKSDSEDIEDINTIENTEDTGDSDTNNNNNNNNNNSDNNNNNNIDNNTEDNDTNNNTENTNHLDYDLIEDNGDEELIDSNSFNSSDDKNNELNKNKHTDAIANGGKVMAKGSKSKNSKKSDLDQLIIQTTENKGDSAENISEKKLNFIKEYLEDIPESKKEKIISDYLEDIPEKSNETSNNEKSNNKESKSISKSSEELTNESSEDLSKNIENNFNNKIENQIKDQYKKQFNELKDEEYIENEEDLKSNEYVDDESAAYKTQYTDYINSMTSKNDSEEIINKKGKESKKVNSETTELKSISKNDTDSETTELKSISKDKDKFKTKNNQSKTSDNFNKKNNQGSIFSKVKSILSIDNENKTKFNNERDELIQSAKSNYLNSDGENDSNDKIAKSNLIKNEDIINNSENISENLDKNLENKEPSENTNKEFSEENEQSEIVIKSPADTSFVEDFDDDFSKKQLYDDLESAINNYMDSFNDGTIVISDNKNIEENKEILNKYNTDLMKAIKSNNDDEIINLTNPKNIDKYLNNMSIGEDYSIESTTSSNEESANIKHSIESIATTKYENNYESDIEEYESEFEDDELIEDNFKNYNDTSNLSAEDFEEVHYDEDNKYSVNKESENNQYNTKNIESDILPKDDEISENPKEFIENFDEIILDDEYVYDPEKDESNKDKTSDYDKDGIDVYETAVGIENPLKKNAVSYTQPPVKRNHRRSVTESISDFKNEMLYLNASLKEIENPTEKKDVYVIDRSEDYEYEDYIIPEHNKETEEEYDNYDSTSNSTNSDYDSTYNSNYSTENKSNEEYAQYPNESNITNEEYAQYSESEFIYPNHSNYLNNENSYNSNKEINQNDSQYNEYSDYDSSDLNTNQKNQESNSDYNADELELNHHNNNIDQIPLNKRSEKDNDINYEPIPFKKSNILDKYEPTPDSKNNNMEDFIIPYEKVESLNITNVEEIYNNSKKLDDTINEIVEKEGPIHIEELVRRLRENCNLSRAGAKFKGVIYDSIVKNEEKGFLTQRNDFLFKDLANVNIRKRDKPNIDLISNMEIESTINLVLTYKKSIKTKDLPKKVSRIFGFKSTSRKTANKINSVIDLMLDQGKIINKNNKIKFNK